MHTSEALKNMRSSGRANEPCWCVTSLAISTTWLAGMRTAALFGWGKKSRKAGGTFNEAGLRSFHGVGSKYPPMKARVGNIRQ
jgi:hypothetical protein